MMDGGYYPRRKSKEELEREKEDEDWALIKFPPMRVIHIKRDNNIEIYAAEYKKWFRWKEIRSDMSFFNSMFFPAEWIEKTDEKTARDMIRAYKRWLAYQEGDKAFTAHVIHEE